MADRVERWSSLLELLGRDGRLSVEDAAERLGVSTATIRRDFDELAEQRQLVRTRGGAVANGVAHDLPLRYKTARNADEKQRIARAVAELVPQHAVVGLNGGTTTTEVARALVMRAEIGADPGITIVTNAVNIAYEMAVRPDVKVVLTGGVARAQSYELIGPLAHPVLEELVFDVTILGADAVDAVVGATARNEGEAAINRLLAASGRQVIVATDSTKLGGRAFARICRPEGIDVLVTDRAASDETVEAFEAAGVHVIRA